MQTDIPEHYKSLAPTHPTSPVAPGEAHVHNMMYEADKQLRTLDTNSIWYLQDQGASEINISLLGQHVNKELGIISDVGVKTDRSLDEIANAVRTIEEETRKWYVANGSSRYRNFAEI